MQEYTFSEVADRMQIGPGFSDNNVLAYDGDLDRLPKIKLVRHGNVGKQVSDCRIEIGQGARGALTIFVGEGAAIVKIGRNTVLNINIRLWRSPSVEIGDFTTINNARIVADKSDVKIGRDCLFSDEILIQSSDQHGLIDLATGEFTNQQRRFIDIGDHVWVGRRAIVMPDVRIGAGSVLGTGSTLTADADPCSYYVGVPARKVREGASWTRKPHAIAPIEEEFFEKMRAERAAQGVSEL